MKKKDTVKLKDVGHKLEEKRSGQMKSERNSADHANTETTALAQK
jgi:hypothetical protein